MQRDLYRYLAHGTGVLCGQTALFIPDGETLVLRTEDRDICISVDPGRFPIIWPELQRRNGAVIKEIRPERHVDQELQPQDAFWIGFPGIEIMIPVRGDRPLASMWTSCEG